MKNIIKLAWSISVVWVGFMVISTIINECQRSPISDIDKLTSEKEQLTKRLDSLSQQSDSIKTALYQKIELDSVSHITEMNRIKSEHSKEIAKIKSLSTSEQIKLLEHNIQEDVSAIKVNNDTAIVIKESGITTINTTFCDLQYKTDENEQLNKAILNISNNLNTSKLVISMKDSEIMTYKQLSQKDNEIISELNKTLLNERKAAKKRIIKYSIISASSGVLIGLLYGLR